MMSKKADSKYAILDCISNRWSPRSFSDKEVPKDVLKKMLEAMSWAASGYNAQPWRVIIGRKGHGETYEKLFQCLNPWNQSWAKSAPVLMLMVGETIYSHNGEANGSFVYDCGAAASNFCLQGVEDDVLCHQMGGILPEKAVEIFEIPEGFKVLTGMAIGYLGELGRIDVSFHEGEKAARWRKNIGEITFGSEWGKSNSELF